MFVLRRFSGEGIEMNHAIGDSYTYIHRETNPEQFRDTFKVYFKKNHVADLDETSDDDSKRVYAFVCSGAYNQPLWANQKAYIMTESGKTFANISFR